MSAACREADALGQLLAERSENGLGLDGLWRDYFVQTFEQTRAPWLFAAMADLSQEGTTGEFPSEEMQSVELLGKLVQLSDQGNQDAKLLLASISSMRKPLSALFDPEITEALAV